MADEPNSREDDKHLQQQNSEQYNDQQQYVSWACA